MLTGVYHPIIQVKLMSMWICGEYPWNSSPSMRSDPGKSALRTEKILFDPSGDDPDPVHADKLPRPELRSPLRVE